MIIKKKVHLVYCIVSKTYLVSSTGIQDIYPLYKDVVAVDVNFDVPDSFMPDKIDLEALRRKRAEITDKASNELIDIDRKINELEKIKNAD